METIMREPSSQPHSTTRRSKFMASVAAVGLLAAIAGSGISQNVNILSLAGPAKADTAVQPSGFADLVEKVKPAVISVRVKLDQPARQTSMNDNENAVPSRRGSPMDQFFQNSPMRRFFDEFGFDNGP